MTATATIGQLPQRDQLFLRSKETSHVIAQVGPDLHVTFPGFVLPEAYQPRSCELRIILPAGYDVANPDMFWTRPDVRLLNGNFPLTADYKQEFPDGAWQRWSRHVQQWRAGVDCLRTYMAAIRRELARGL